MTAPRKQARRFRGSWVEARYVGVLGPLVVLAIVVAIWQVAAQLIHNSLLAPLPFAVVRGGVYLVTSGVLAAALVISIREMYIGMAIACSVGIIVGVAMGRYAVVDSVLGPFVNSLNATPGIVFIPLLVVWVGVGMNARIALIFISTIWPVLLNAAAGTRNLNRRYMEVGISFGLSERTLMWKVALPALMPYIMTGLRIGLGVGVVAMIISEMEVSEVGLGYSLLFYGDAYMTARLIALVMIVAMFGVAHVLILRAIQLRWARWTVVK